MKQHKKVVFVIPGYREYPTDPSYKAVCSMLKKEGYQPICIRLSWTTKTLSENAAKFLETYKNAPSDKKYILGFSFGAMVALLTASKISVDGIILCSLSPYFQEDLHDISLKNASVFRIKQYSDLSTLQCYALTKQVKAKKVHMLYGEDEDESLIARVKQAFAQITLPEKQLIKIQNTDHNIGHKNYLSSIRQITRALQ